MRKVRGQCGLAEGGDAMRLDDRRIAGRVLRPGWDHGDPKKQRGKAGGVAHVVSPVWTSERLGQRGAGLQAAIS